LSDDNEFIAISQLFDSIGVIEKGIEKIYHHLLKHKRIENLEQVRNLMLTPISGEITEREPYNGYLVFQGGIPEVESFLKRYHK